MEEIGKTLRETRERLGLTLDEVAKTTRIRQARLEALERGEMGSMPSEAQARGFLRNYADALGMDGEELLGRYGTASHEKTGAQKAVSAGAQASRSSRSNSELLISALVALGVIAVLVWGGGRLLETLAGNSDDATAEALANVPKPMTPTVIPSEAPPPSGASIAQPTAPTPTSTLILNVLDRVDLRIVAETDSFVEVIVDDVETFRGRMQAGDEQSFIGDTAITVTTGNAGGLRIYFNDLDQGLMGEIGQVLVRVWTPRGPQTPTPTVTMSPTASPFLTETATVVPSPSETQGP